MVDYDLSPQKSATKMLDEKYGEGNWIRGDGEYGKIVKWIQRDIFDYGK